MAFTSSPIPNSVIIPDNDFIRCHEFCSSVPFEPLISITGHVFAFGESRALAIANMVLGLKEIQIRGEIRTNVDYTVDLLNVS